jgi:hypothetical protein
LQPAASEGGQKIRSYGEVAIGGILLRRSDERILRNVKAKGANHGKTDTKQNSRPGRAGLLFSATTIAALLFLAAKFPHRQFNSSELCVLSGIGRTSMSQIKNAADSPFSLGKCTLQRLDGWLAKHPGFKQQ